MTEDFIQPHQKRIFTGILNTQNRTFLSPANLLQQTTGSNPDELDHAVQEVYTALLEKQESSEKMTYYESKLKFKNQKTLLKAEAALVLAVVDTNMNGNVPYGYVFSIDEAKEAYRAELEKVGIGAQTSKLLVMQTEKDTREVLTELYPQLGGQNP